MLMQALDRRVVTDRDPKSVNREFARQSNDAGSIWEGFACPYMLRYHGAWRKTVVRTNFGGGYIQHKGPRLSQPRHWFGYVKHGADRFTGRRTYARFDAAGSNTSGVILAHARRTVGRTSKS